MRNIIDLSQYDELNVFEKVAFFANLPDSRKPKRGLFESKGYYDSPKPCAIEFHVDGKRTQRKNPAFASWFDMLRRCYNRKSQLAYPTYLGVTVCESWLKFSNFYNWWKDNYKTGYHLDKDLLSDKRMYSPETCIYVPLWLNNFTNAHGRGRGEYLIGATFNKKGGKFEAWCSYGNGKGRTYLGTYSTEVEASNTWRLCKLKLALSRKQEMDEIDTRIYPRVVHIINNVQ